MSQMMEMLRTTRVVGLKRLMKLSRAHRLAWPGIMNGFYTTRILQTLFNVGLFDEMKGGRQVDIEAFAASKRLDARILASLCDALYALRLLERQGKLYRLSEDGNLLNDVGRGWFDAAYGYEEVFHNLEGLLRQECRYGDTVTRRSDFVAKGSGEVEAWLYFPLAIDAIRKRGCTHALDLGCGDGTFLRQLCGQIPGVKGYGIDLAPEAIADGNAELKAAGMQDRIRLFVEDISKLDQVPYELSRVDVATTFFVLHELMHSGEERVVQFLRDFRRLFPKVPLMIYEVDRPTVDEMRRRPGMAVPYLVQHDVSNQRPVDRKAWRALLQHAGFTSVEERNLPFARSVIFTAR
jgi:SAM-dependent methyltransferase